MYIRESTVMHMAKTSKKSVNSKRAKKTDVGKELEMRIKASQTKFSKSQQDILRQMKEKKDNEFNVKLTDSLNRAFSIETENGVTLMDEIAAKVATQYKESETIGIKDVVSLREALGENKTKVDVELGGKIDIQKELKNLVDESEF